MARDKFYEARIAGMLYALNTAKKEGIDGLEKELKKRNLLHVPLAYTNAEIDGFWNKLSENIYNNMLVTVLWVLYNNYGFRTKRLKDFTQKYNEAVNAALDLDYLGEHYVTLTDYAVELNQQCNMELNTAISEFCQESHDAKNPNYQNTRYLTGIINTLRIYGYTDAANFLQERKDSNNYGL